MCLIIHKPAGAEVPEELLSAAAVHNRDGWGLMGFAPGGGLLLERHPRVDLEQVVEVVHRHRQAEFVLHLRRQTRGGSGLDNVHPFKVLDGLYLMHNGTLPVTPRIAGRSDTWHFANDLLRPLAANHPGLLSDPRFLKVLEFGLRAENKLAILDERERRIVLVNRAQGLEFEGLWLSNSRWVDRGLLPLAYPPQPQARSYQMRDLGLLA